MRSTLALAIFALTYALVAARRWRLLPIGRPAAALLGAALVVLLGVLAPQDAYASLDGDTLTLLFGTMVLRVEFERSGLLDAWVARTAARRVRPRALLVGVVFGAGGLSALLVNDAICLLATPLVVRVCRATALPPVPYLLALAVGANVGAVMTLTGAPQCALIGAASGISYARYAATMVPVGLACLSVASAVLLAAFSRTLRGATPRVATIPFAVDRGRSTRFVVATTAVLVGFLAGLPIAWVALGGAVLVFVLSRRDPRDDLERVDWPLLLFFAGLFVVVGGVAATGWVTRAVEGLAPWIGPEPSLRPVPFAGFSLVASNLFSNVPFALVMSRGYPAAPDAFWHQLALTTTLAGNLTLLGSVANVIVAEAAEREGVRVGFLEHLRVGVPVTLATTVTGLVVLSLLGYA